MALRRGWILPTLVVAGAAEAAAQERATGEPRVRVLAGFTDTGTATPQWLTMLKRRLPDADAESWARQIRPPRRRAGVARVDPGPGSRVAT